MIKVVLITAVALMSGCGTSAQFYENRVVEEDVVCPIGSSAYHLPGVLSSSPHARSCREFYRSPLTRFGSDREREVLSDFS